MKRISVREEDLMILRDIAKKYDMTVDKFCNTVLETNIGTSRQIRFSDEEYNLIKMIAKSNSLTFNAFVNVCLREYLEKKDEQTLDKQDMLLNLDSNKRTKRVNIDFNNVIFAQKLNRMALYYGMKLPSIVRYIVFKYINENYEVRSDGTVVLKKLKS